MYAQGKTVGVAGQCDNNIGIFGNSSSATGVVGQSGGNGYGVSALSNKSIALNATGGIALLYIRTTLHLMQEVEVYKMMFIFLHKAMQENLTEMYLL